MSAEKNITTSNLEYYHNETVKKLNTAVNELNSLVGKVNVPNAIADLTEQIESASGTANGQQYNSSTNTTTFIKNNSLGSVKVGNLFIQDNSHSKNIIDFVNERDNNLQEHIDDLNKTHVRSMPLKPEEMDIRVQNCIFNAVKNWNEYSDLGNVREAYTDDTRILPSITVNVQKFDSSERGTAWFTHYVNYYVNYLTNASNMKPMRYDYIVARISHSDDVYYEQCYIVISNALFNNKHMYLHLHHREQGDLVYYSLLTATQINEFLRFNNITLSFKLTERTDVIEQDSELLITSGAVYDGLQEIKDLAVNSGHTYDPNKVSIAEGNSTATGAHSHAEGNETNAKGVNAHSEGSNTNAIGNQSHAEGGLCLALGSHSHAENDTTMALGAASHSEGVDSLAIATASHAEGNGTIASEYCSHASGQFTNALGQHSFTMGKSRLNTKFTFDISGISVQNSGNFERNKIVITVGGTTILPPSINSNILYLRNSGNSQLIYVSQINVDQRRGKITVLTKNNYPCSSATETTGFTTGSFAEYAITAKGKASFVGGYVDGSNSSKICSVTTDSNELSGSIAFGTIFSRYTSNDNNVIQTSAIASTAIGYINDGKSAEINGSADGSLARGCITESIDSIIESAGKGSIASGCISGASSAFIKTEGEGSFALGCVEGNNSYIRTYGDGSIAQGCVNSDDAFIEANGEGSVAQGYVDSEHPNIIASGKGSHAEGIGTHASGEGSHAEGIGTCVSGIEIVNTGINAVGRYDANSLNFNQSVVNIFKKNDILVINGNDHLVTDVHNGPYYVQFESPLSDDDVSWATTNNILRKDININTYCAHAEGIGTCAIGEGSHAEGFYTKAMGKYSHAEGANFEQHGPFNAITIDSSTRQVLTGHGYYCDSNRSYLANQNFLISKVLTGKIYRDSTYTDFVCNVRCIPIVDVLSGKTLITVEDLGDSTPVLQNDVRYYITIIKDCAASGNYSHAEGQNTQAVGESSHAEGFSTEALGHFSHAEGVYTFAKFACHSEGYETYATGVASHAEGRDTRADGYGSHAGGIGTRAYEGMTAIGRYNSIDDEIYGSDILFAIGNGEGDNLRKNVFTVNKDGNVYFNNNKVLFAYRQDDDCYIQANTNGTNLKIRAYNEITLETNNDVIVNSPEGVYANSFNPLGSDYAELFEWHDGNKKDEDRTGYFVTITTDGKIKKAKNTDEILGIVSACPGIIGNNPIEWHKKYKRDVFGRILHDENNKPIINEEYDETQQYIRRSQRKEWSPIGLLGQLIVLDDGSCQAGKKCSVNKNGIATNGDSYLVLQRLDDNHIKILFK